MFVHILKMSSARIFIIELSDIMHFNRSSGYFFYNKIDYPCKSHLNRISTALSNHAEERAKEMKKIVIAVVRICK